MQSQFTLFDLLIIIGITQGVITGILLLTSKKNKKSNKYLSLALFAFCFLSTKPLLHTLNLWDLSFFRFFPNGTEVLIAPLIYFFVLSLIQPDFRFRKIDWLHFVPFFISQLYAFFIYFSALGIHSFADKDAFAVSMLFNEVKKLEDYLAVVSISIYLYLGFKLLIDYKKWLQNNISDNTYPDFDWLRNIYIAGSILGLVLFINLALDIIFDLRTYFHLHWEGFAILMAAVIYYLGIVTYKQPEFQQVTTFREADDRNPAKTSSEEVSEVQGLILRAMNEGKVFLDPTINIKQLSELLDVPKRTLSEVINQSFGRNFRDFINDFRIEDVKRNLTPENLQVKSILGIALESGFNSEASFYRIFKKKTGLSPKEYLNA